MRIGIDLDNTLIDYDDLFRAVAADMGAGACFTPMRSRQAARDMLRQEPGGEILWQEIQARVYGPDIIHASLFEGAVDCLRHWQAAGHELRIISHKSVYAARDKGKVNLREAADRFLAAKGLGDIPAEYYSQRDDKISAIATFDAQVFIDDLPEVLQHQLFPKSCAPILFDGDWQKVRDQVEQVIHAA